MRLLVAVSSLAFALSVMGCGGPTELTNADIERTRKELSKENYEKSLQSQGKSAEVEQMRREEAERAEERQR